MMTIDMVTRDDDDYVCCILEKWYGGEGGGGGLDFGQSPRILSTSYHTWSTEGKEGMWVVTVWGSRGSEREKKKKKKKGAIHILLYYYI